MAESNRITAQELRETLTYSPETGEFFWLAPGRGRRFGTPVGSWDLHGYKTVRLGGRSYKLHRLAWLHVHGAWPVGDIDHINGNRIDNRIANLRDVPRGVNLENQRKATNNRSTGLLGAYYDQRKRNYYARISIGDKSVHLGTFQTAEAAHAAYLEAKRRMHAGCTI